MGKRPAQLAQVASSDVDTISFEELTRRKEDAKAEVKARRRESSAAQWPNVVDGLAFEELLTQDCNQVEVMQDSQILFQECKSAGCQSDACCKRNFGRRVPAVMIAAQRKSNATICIAETRLRPTSLQNAGSPRLADKVQEEVEVTSRAPAEPCPICMDDATEGLLSLRCGHVAHKACLDAMISARWSGKRITFNYMNCFMCRQQLDHPKLKSILASHNELRRKVMSISVSACNKQELIKNLDDWMKEDPQAAEAAAAAEIACFECAECGEPYAAGRVDCGVEEGIDVSKMKCDTCLWKSPSEHKCSKHGLEEAMIKCDWCCNIATFKCGPGMYCNECHQPPYAHTMPLHDPNGSEPRKVSQGQKCPGPDKCPLRMPHPENGTAHKAFVVGCLHCRC